MTCGRLPVDATILETVKITKIFVVDARNSAANGRMIFRDGRGGENQNFGKEPI